MAQDSAAKTFDWEDPLDMKSRLSEEETMVWDAARSYAREKLLPRVVSAYAEEITRWPPLAVRTAKKVLQTNFESDLDTALKYESVGLSFARRAVNDVKESRASFLEKRKGVYTGT